MAGKSLKPERLPPQYRSLLEFHDALEKIYCFMIKRKMTVTVSKVEKIYKELVGGVSGDTSINILDNICDLCACCPEAYKLRLCDQNSPTSCCDLELSLCLFPSATNMHAQKRRTHLTVRLSDLTVRSFAKWVTTEGSACNGKYGNASQIIKAINNDDWPPTFDTSKPENISAPVITDEMKELRRSYTQKLACPAPPADDFGFGSSSSTNNHSSAPSVLSTSLEDSGGAEGVLDYLKCQPFYKDQIKHVEHVPSKEARYGVLAPPAIPVLLQQRLQEALGLQQLYLHQARAIDALRAGKHTVISTSTASGKSVIYNIPVLEAVLQDPQVTALYLFPTKALAQDQLRSLLAVTGDGSLLPVSVAVCDGDTPQCERARVQFPAEVGAPNIILTNPDMLHCTMLPDHRAWKRIYENIRFVVIDEAHLYRGAFGSHVAAVLRRLLRVCLYYGRCPQFLCCSATIANPAQHMSKLVPLHALFSTPPAGVPLPSTPPTAGAATHSKQQDGRGDGGGGGGERDYLAVVGADSDGAPQGERLFVIWNPPLQQNSAKEGDVKASVVSASSSSSVWEPKKMAEAFLRKPGSSNTSSSSSGSSEPQPEGMVGDAAGEGGTVVTEVVEQVKPNAAGTVAAVLSPKKQSFLQGCEDSRPATMGRARDTHTDDPGLHLRHKPAAAQRSTEDAAAWPASSREYEVRYVGGWKRGRSAAEANSRVASSTSSAESGVDAASAPDTAADATEDAPELYEDLGLSTSFGAQSGSIAVPQVRRLSSIFETSNIFCALVKKHLRTLAFCKVRKLVELVLGYSLRNFETTGAAHLTSSVASYRGGYTKEERRAIESDLFSGRLLGVTATCALELGIDVGALDATLHMGFPGTYSSLWQQAGRAGRSGRPSLSIMVCFESPIDQYFARHPEVLFGSPVEPALLDINNAHILYSHLLCAAEEVPLNYKFTVSGNSSSGLPHHVTDQSLWGERYTELLQYLVDANKVVRNASSRFATSASVVDPRAPGAQKIEAYCGAEWRVPVKSAGKSRASAVSLRMIDPVTISILDDSRGGVVIDSLGYSRAFFELFEGAIYMHRAVQYRVLRLDLAAAVAHTQPVKVRYYTSAQNKTEVNVLKVLEQDGLMSCGAVQVVRTVYGYVKHWLGSGDPFEKGECSLPPLEYETCAFWIDLPVQVKRTLEAERFCPISSIHAANHALLAVSPLFAQCDATDLDTEHSIAHSALEQTFRIMIFDLSVGGLGASTTLFQSGREVLRRALDLIADCACDYAVGCPCCTLQARCSHHNQDLSRRGAARLLELVLDLLTPTGEPTAAADTVDADHHARNAECEGGGFLRLRSGSYASTCGTGATGATGSPSSAKATARYAGPVGAAPLTKNSSAGAASSGAFGVDPSPRKARRQKSLKAAFYRDRAHQMAIQMNWTEAVPSFYQESDMAGENK